MIRPSGPKCRIRAQMQDPDPRERVGSQRASVASRCSAAGKGGLLVPSTRPGKTGVNSIALADSGPRQRVAAVTSMTPFQDGPVPESCAHPADRVGEFKDYSAPSASSVAPGTVHKFRREWLLTSPVSRYRCRVCGGGPRCRPLRSHPLNTGRFRIQRCGPVSARHRRSPPLRSGRIPWPCRPGVRAVRLRCRPHRSPLRCIGLPRRRHGGRAAHRPCQSRLQRTGPAGLVLLDSFPNLPHPGHLLSRCCRS
jgi:hypothetical protein